MAENKRIELSPVFTRSYLAGRCNKPIFTYSPFLSVRRVTIPLPLEYQSSALPIELRTVAGVFRYLLITSNGPLLGEFAGKVGFEPTNLQFQMLVFTDVTLYFTIISEEIRKSVFEFLPLLC